MKQAHIWRNYYPKGAVDFFLAHHSEDNIMKDIERNRVFLCLDGSRNAVGTVTIKKNEISRLFVLPSYQGMGYGTEMLDFAEQAIFTQYSKIVLDASLPAKKIYQRRGYKDMEFNSIAVGFALSGSPAKPCQLFQGSWQSMAAGRNPIVRTVIYNLSKYSLASNKLIDVAFLNSLTASVSFPARFNSVTFCFNSSEI